MEFWSPLEPQEIASQSGLPILKNKELILCSQDNVGFYEGETRLTSTYENGVLTLTNIRLVFMSSVLNSDHKAIQISLNLISNIHLVKSFLKRHPKLIIRYICSENNNFESISTISSVIEWICDICNTINRNMDKCVECGVKFNQESSKIICPNCTLHNIASNIQCNICQTNLQNDIKDSKIDTWVNVEKSVSVSKDKYTKISFRGSGSQLFTERLQKAIENYNQSAAHNLEMKHNNQLNPTTNPTMTSPQNSGGVAALMRSVQQVIVSDHEGISQSFQDLDVLMNRASQMVTLAENIKMKLIKAQSSDVNDQEKSQLAEFESFLVEVGITNPITK